MVFEDKWPAGSWSVSKNVRDVEYFTSPDLGGFCFVVYVAGETSPDGTRCGLYLASSIPRRARRENLVGEFRSVSEAESCARGLATTINNIVEHALELANPKKPLSADLVHEKDPRNGPLVFSNGDDVSKG